VKLYCRDENKGLKTILESRYFDAGGKRSKLKEKTRKKKNK
jgi:hypothetical protein